MSPELISLRVGRYGPATVRLRERAVAESDNDLCSESGFFALPDVEIILQKRKTVLDESANRKQWHESDMLGLLPDCPSIVRNLGVSMQDRQTRRLIANTLAF